MLLGKKKKAELRFVGEDSSMGLSHGRCYEVAVFTMGGYLWVEWAPHPPWPASGEPMRRCPYASTVSFAKNWELPKRGGGTT